MGIHRKIRMIMSKDLLAMWVVCIFAFRFVSKHKEPTGCLHALVQGDRKDEVDDMTQRQGHDFQFIAVQEFAKGRTRKEPLT